MITDAPEESLERSAPDGNEALVEDSRARLDWTRGLLKFGARTGLEPVLRRLARRFESRRTSRGLVYLRKVGSPALTVLAYHRVLREADPYLPAMREGVFRAQMRRLARSFRVLSLDEAVDRLERGDLPHDAVSLTFDDGYRDNYDIVWPILRELGLPATIFLTTGAIDTGRPLWYDRVFRAFSLTTRSRLPGTDPGAPEVAWSSRATKATARDRTLANLKASPAAKRESAIDRIEAALDVGPVPDGDRIMLDWDQVREMHAHGIDFGAHTIDHPILTRVDRSRARREIVGSRDRIATVLGALPSTFAYPNGRAQDFDDEIRAMVSDAGFRCAVTTIFGVDRSATNAHPLDRFAIRRCGINDADPDVFACRLSYYRLALAAVP